MSSTRTGGPCPKCHGAGQVDEFGIGLLVACDECGGAFTSEHQDDQAGHGSAPVWAHPAVTGTAACHVCLGTGVVVNLGGTGEPTGAVVELPCPACSREQGPGTGSS